MNDCSKKATAASHAFLSTNHLDMLCVCPLLLSLILLLFSALLPPPPLYIHCCLTAPSEPACGAVELCNRGAGEGNNRKDNRKHKLCAALESNIVNMQVREGKTRHHVISVMHACLHTDLTPIPSTLQRGLHTHTRCRQRLNPQTGAP